jgi:putative sigma-54 modulation protein
MKISVTFRNAEGDTWHKEYVDERLKKLNKYIDNPAEARVVLWVEKFRHFAEINLTANGLNVNAKEEEKEMHLAIDAAIDKIERQLKKHREKIREHKGAGSREEIIVETESALDISDTDSALEAADSRVVETRQIILKPMSLDDALFEIGTTRNRFFIYRDANTNNVNVLFRRDDGKYTLIETNY